MRTPSYGHRLRIGLMIPCRNTVLEPDAAALLPEGVSMHVTRMPTLGATRADLLSQFERLGESAQLLASAGVGLVGFHCTAAATIDATVGSDIAARLGQHCDLPAVATSQALLAALAAFRAQRIVLITPYVQSVNDHEVEFFAGHGIQVIREIGMGKKDAKGMESIEPAEWVRQALGARHREADAYVLSCANIRVASVIDELEERLEAPVITSNQAMLWHCLRMGGIGEAVRDYGALLEKH